MLCDIGRWRESVGRPLRYDDADPIEPDELLECLAAQQTDLRTGDILLMHDGHAARTPDGQAVILAVLPRLLATLHEHHLQPVTLNEALP